MDIQMEGRDTEVVISHDSFNY